MINSAFVSYSLPAPFRRPLMLPPSRWRLFFEFLSFGHCYSIFLRAGVCVLFRSCATARLGVSYEVRCAHPPRTALCRADLALLALCRRPSAFVAVARAGGRSRALAPPPLSRTAGGRASRRSVVLGLPDKRVSTRTPPYAKL